MRVSCALAGAVCVAATSEAFVFSPSVRYRSPGAGLPLSQTAGTETEPATAGVVLSNWPEITGEHEVLDIPSSSWDCKSVPAKSFELQNIPEDARNWEVEGDRLEVWEGDPNPSETVDWLSGFAPSVEEVEAAAVGFDFENPEKWLEGKDEKITRQYLDGELEEVSLEDWGDETGGWER